MGWIKLDRLKKNNPNPIRPSTRLNNSTQLNL